MKKKPDQVVYDSEKKQYDAKLKEYSTNVGAPAISTDDVTTWKNANINKVNHQFKTRFETIRASYEAMMEQYEYNNLIYSAKFSFEPVIGETYYLYESKNGDVFLSLIAPQECNFEYLGTFVLNTDKMWVKKDEK